MIAHVMSNPDLTFTIGLLGGLCVGFVVGYFLCFWSGL